MSDFAVSSILPGAGAPAEVLSRAKLSKGSGAPGAPADSRDPAKAQDAAQQFEALLMGQILRSAREGGTGWLGSEDDASGE